MNIWFLFPELKVFFLNPSCFDCCQSTIDIAFGKLSAVIATVKVHGLGTKWSRIQSHNRNKWADMLLKFLQYSHFGYICFLLCTLLHAMHLLTLNFTSSKCQVILECNNDCILCLYVLDDFVKEMWQQTRIFFFFFF